MEMETNIDAEDKPPGSPLIRESNIGNFLNKENIFLKYEGINPTGTQKDRISRKHVENAISKGYDRISVATCGNYGASIAYYADKYGIEAANKIRNFNYPVVDGGLVITDIDSYSDECNMNDLLKSVYKIFENNHAIYIIDTASEKEINNIMEVRRIAFTSPGILYKNFIDGDIVVPLSNIEELLIRLNKLRKKYKNVFLSICGHAGDGNLHPQIGYDEKYKNDAFQEVLEINRIAINLNGTISGEHGIGKIKNELLLEQFHKRNMDINYEFMKSIKKLFDPDDILNPGNFGL